MITPQDKEDIRLLSDISLYCFRQALLDKVKWLFIFKKRGEAYDLLQEVETVMKERGLQL